MTSIKLAVLGAAALGIALAAPRAGAQDTFRDATALTQFQRAADAYAFQHRQIQRRLGEGADPAAMAAGMRAARLSAAEGDFFTPMAAAAFRQRIHGALRASSCQAAMPASLDFEVPRTGLLRLSTQPVPGCVLAMLPRLPEELEYRVAGVALILVDTHANLVVDVLHGAF